MVTSLAHFRSDYTIVHIPRGNLLAVKDQLYVNINLLRMGCSGRSALTLEEPSDSTKDRFISAYQLPDTTVTRSSFLPAPTSSEYLPLPPPLSHQSSSASQPPSSPPRHFHSIRPSLQESSSTFSKPSTGIGLVRPSIHVISPTSPNLTPNRHKDREKISKGKTKDRAAFNATVLELVKLIQAGLAIFGMYDVADPSTSALIIDGLLCDVTVDGIRKWTAEVGEPCIGVEPTERIADPLFVSALLSLVLSIRNKLAFLGFSQILPKDPFLFPVCFSVAVLAYVQSIATPAAVTSNTSNASQHGYSHSISSTASFLGPHNVVTQAAPLSIVAALSRDLVESISTTYLAKTRVGEGRRVRRVLKGKLDDLTNAVSGSSNVAGFDSEGDDWRGTLSGGEGIPDRMTAQGVVSSQSGIGASGGQILSGIGSLASGLGLGGSGGPPSGAGSIMEGTMDLAWFVGAATAKESFGHMKKGRRKSKERKRESVDLGVGYGVRGREKDTVVAGSVKSLWSGHVADLVQIREWEADRERDGGLLRAVSGGSERDKDRWKRSIMGMASDGDADDHDRDRAKSDGRSTEEESDAFLGGGGSFGGMWGGRVRGKLGSWTGLSRKRGQNLDMSSIPLSVSPSKVKETAMLTPKLVIGSTSASTHQSSESGPQSPTLPPMVFAGDLERYPDEEELLSSGQVSPLGDYRPNPFNMLHDGPSVDSSTTNLNSLNSQEYDRNLSKLINSKRPWARRLSQTRIPTWSDPVSARGEVLDEEDEGGVEDYEDAEGSDLSDFRKPGSRWKAREKARFHSLLSVVDGEGVLVEEPLHESSESEEDELRKKWSFHDSRRRRSFHDLESLLAMPVLTAERMKIDVEIAGQVLIMARREQHLRNVVACLEALTSSLLETNTRLREGYEANLENHADVEVRTTVLADIDAENAKADKISQATNTLRYESEQFRVSDLWQAASPSRKKVLGLREKVFGTGGRRLPAGVHGAHGRFNRLQWTIRGEERLVDYLGRTESEAEEESKVDPQSLLIIPPEIEEDEVVEHPGIKPMWLLRFFTSWGARWSAAPLVKEVEVKSTNVEDSLVTGNADVGTAQEKSPVDSAAVEVDSSSP